MPFCIKCGHEIPVGAAFCPNCGAPVAPKVAAPVKPKAVSKKPSMRARLKHYTDSETGFSLDYPDLAEWKIQKPKPQTLMFTNDQLEATLVFGFTQLPNVVPDLPDIFDATVAHNFGSIRRSSPQARLLSSRLVTNPNNGVKGVELIYTDKVKAKVDARIVDIFESYEKSHPSARLLVKSDLWKGRLTIFFKGSKRYDVLASALQENFDRADREFFTPVLKSFNF